MFNKRENDKLEFLKSQKDPIKSDISLETIIGGFNTLIDKWNLYFARELHLHYIFVDKIIESHLERLIQYIKGYKTQKRLLSEVITNIYPYTTSSPPPSAYLRDSPSRTLLAKKILSAAKLIYQLI